MNKADLVAAMAEKAGVRRNTGSTERYLGRNDGRKK